MRKPKTIQERMAQIKVAQEAGGFTRCPRCGENTMTLGDRLCTNALSRQYDIMICDSCGLDEAKMAFMGAPKPLAHWACLNAARDDFKDTPSAQALRRIEEEQIPFLQDLYRYWLTQPAVDWEAYRLDAYDRCPGLTTLWFEPFVARYTVAEGVLVISFRMRDGTAQYAADLIADDKHITRFPSRPQGRLFSSRETSATWGTLPPVAASSPALGYFPGLRPTARHGANVGRI